MSSHDLLNTAELTIEQFLPMVLGGLIAAVGFFLKSFFSAGETTRKEIREIMVEIGAIAKDIENIKKDLDAIGNITRELRK